MKTETKFKLSSEKRQFAELIENHAPEMSHIWDFEKEEYLPEMGEKFIGVASSGQVILLHFFQAVWFHRDKFNFDITDAASTLDYEKKQMISEWFLNPFWP